MKTRTPKRQVPRRRWIVRDLLICRYIAAVRLPGVWGAPCPSGSGFRASAGEAAVIAGSGNPRGGRAAEA